MLSVVAALQGQGAPASPLGKHLNEGIIRVGLESPNMKGEEAGAHLPSIRLVELLGWPASRVHAAPLP